jgi:hypothetical protein
MRRLLALGILLVSGVSGSSVTAQTFVVGGPVVSPRAGVVASTSGYFIPTYSYYAAFPYPARGYVGYGDNDFPFYGQPYGKPTDRWTWAYMSDPNYGVLARYYYPPVR